MENYEKKILDDIRSDMSEHSRMVVDSVNREISAMREDQLNFYKESLRKETETYLERELASLRSYAALKESQDKLKAKQDLLALRQKYAQEILTEVTARLRTFTKSDGYRDYLAANVDALRMSGTGVFMVRPEDREMLAGILAEKGIKAGLEEGSFAIGGFRYVDRTERVEYSCDLSERLEEAREWFHSHSEFSVPERENA